MGRSRRLTHHDFKKARRAYVCNFCLRRHEVRKKSELPLLCECGNIDWIFFGSKSEANRYGELRLLEMHGQISDLKRQPKFDLVASRFDKAEPKRGRHAVVVGRFTADFEYVENGQRVVEDTKGFAGMTDIAEWKHRHFEAQYGFPVRIVNMK